MKNNRNKRGFTIVELVIVIAVIAILSAALIPAFGNMIQKAKDSKAVLEAKSAYTQYLIENATDTESTEYMIYVIGGRFVALHNGASVGIYETGESALIALFGEESHKYVAPDAESDGLFLCKTVDTDEGNVWDVNNDGKLSVLSIGDAYSDNVIGYAEAIAQNLGINEVEFGKIDSDNYDVAAWDFIVFHQSSLEEIPDDISVSKLVLNMNESYQSQSYSEFSKIIPTYAAVKNSQTSVLGENVEDVEYNDYLMALTLVKTLTETSLDSVTYAPSGMVEYKRLIAIESVINAANDPQNVTNSAYALGDYEILQPA